MTVSQNTANTISVGPLLVPFPDGTYGLIYCPYIPLTYTQLNTTPANSHFDNTAIDVTRLVVYEIKVD